VIVRLTSGFLVAGSLSVLGFAGGTTAAAQGAAPAAALKPVAVAGSKVALTPENTSIGFTGTHKGPKPDPRIGGFEKFAGTAEVDPATKALKSATVEIQTDSLWTQFGKLTTHLKSPDFFDTREQPTARFVTTKVTPGAKAGEAMISGDLTLHGVTKPVTFPATVVVNDGGLTVAGSFKINRSQYGMDRLLDQVNNEVAVTVAVGKKTQKAPPAPAPRPR